MMPHLPRWLVPAAGALVWLSHASGAAASARPNVVLIVSDDHGFGDVGWRNPAVETPHLDRLAAEGVRLDRFYVNPICSVTRGALMTGLASLRTGVNNSSGLDLKYRILPQVFQDAGYQTWMCGKWHLGGPADSQRSGPDYLPHARGFDYFYGHLHGAIDYDAHERKDLGQLDWQRNGAPVVERGFSTDLLADDAIQKVRSRDRTRPFLLYLAFNAVHGPLQPPPSAPRTSRRDRRAVLLANVTHLDAAIGRLLATLADEQLDEETIVLFFSDNGGQLSQGADNGGLRGEKGGTFEGGIRVPAAVRWTGTLPAGRVSDQFMAAMDVLPTLASAADVATGVETPLDGVDLWPALAAGKATDRRPFVMGNKDVACIAPPWKLVLTGPRAAPLLFDVVADPQESRDLSAEHGDVVARLTQIVGAVGEAKGGGMRKAKRPRAPKSAAGPKTPREN
jgi:arylsulfatase A-like enzyme